MARLTRLVLILASAIGFSSGMPAKSQAGVIPWVYDAIFSPAGSMRAGYTPYSAGYSMAGYSPYRVGSSAYSVGYVPYTAGYSNASYGSDAIGYSSYTPTSVAYTPTTSAGYGSSCNSCNTGCNSCSQSAGYGYSQAYYGSSGCNSCASGNCSGGSSCSNCNVNSAPMSNSAPTTAGYGSQAPVPDPNNSRNENLRIYNLERKLEELDHRQKEDEKYLKNQNKDYTPEPHVPRRYDQGESVPARRQNSTFGSDPGSPEVDFSQPAIKNRHNRSGIDSQPEESRKPVLGPPTNETLAPTPTPENSAREIIEAEPEARRLENRVTSRAVAPRERLQIVKGNNSTAVAKSTKTQVKTSESAQSAKVVSR